MLGVGELRVKESDRLSAMAAGLAQCGVSVDAGEDTLTVRGGNGVQGNGQDGSAVAVNLDHRIGMAFAILGLAARNGVRIDDAGPIATSFPDFVPLMNGLGASLTAEKTGA